MFILKGVWGPLLHLFITFSSQTYFLIGILLCVPSPLMFNDVAVRKKQLLYWFSHDTKTKERGWECENVWRLNTPTKQKCFMGIHQRWVLWWYLRTHPGVEGQNRRLYLQLWSGGGQMFCQGSAHTQPSPEPPLNEQVKNLSWASF